MHDIELNGTPPLNPVTKKKKGGFNVLLLVKLTVCTQFHCDCTS